MANASIVDKSPKSFVKKTKFHDGNIKCSGAVIYKIILKVPNPE